MKDRFPAHGDFDISVDGALVITQITGPWNAQLLQRWVVALEPFSQEARQHGRYGGITVVSRSVLCPPDALAIMRQRTQWSVQNHPYVGTAFVLAPDVEGAALARSVYAKVYHGVCAFNVFADLPAAKAWLMEQIHGPAAERVAFAGSKERTAGSGP